MGAALTGAGCTATGVGTDAPALHLAAPAQAPAEPWWRQAGDPLLADLVEEGLAHAPQVVAAAEPPHRDWLHRAPDPADLHTRADTAAEAQAENALAIGLAYVEARSAQARLTLREDAVAGLRDNDEIAGFRREAGLVSAVDTGLAGVLVGLNDNAILAARAARDAAVATLATLIGDTAGPLTARIERAPVLRVYAPQAAVPVETALGRRADLMVLQDKLGSDLGHHHITQAQLDAALAGQPATGEGLTTAAAAWQEALARARDDIDLANVALSAARARLASATTTSSAAESTVSDARLAYRGGKETMGALYVAEAAALSAREGLADGGAAVDSALLRLWAAQGGDMAAQDAVVPMPVVAPVPATGLAAPAPTTPPVKPSMPVPASTQQPTGLVPPASATLTLQPTAPAAGTPAPTPVAPASKPAKTPALKPSPAANPTATPSVAATSTPTASPPAAPTASPAPVPAQAKLTPTAPATAPASGAQ